MHNSCDVKIIFWRGEEVLFNICLHTFECRSRTTSPSGISGPALAWVMGGPSITLLRRDLSHMIPSTSLVLPLTHAVTDYRKHPKAPVRNRGTLGWAQCRAFFARG